jgi:predicted Zn-dependent peptidase
MPTKAELEAQLKALEEETPKQLTKRELLKALQDLEQKELRNGWSSEEGRFEAIKENRRMDPGWSAFNLLLDKLDAIIALLGGK